MSQKQILAVLIQEDSADALLVRNLLEVDTPGLACSLECVQSVEAGLQRIGQGHVDLVLLDLELSAAATVDTLRRLCSGPLAALPVIALGNQDEQAALQALQAGVQDYLVKGHFNGAALSRSIRCAIERNNAVQQALARKMQLGPTIQSSQKQDEEYQRTAETLRHSERKFRAIFDHTFQLVGLVAPDGTVLESNRTALEFSGINESDVVGKPFWDTPWWAHSKEQQERVRAAVNDAAKGRFVRFEATHIKRDGSLHHIDFSLKPVMDDAGQVTLIIAEGRDVTERKKTEDALWESSQMLKLVLDHMPAFVFWKDCNSVYLGCNYLFAENAGLTSPEAIVGLTDLDLPWKYTEAESYRGDDRAVMESGISKLNYEETQKTADGRLIAVRTSKIPLRNSEGRIVGVLGTFEDISERKRAEQMLAEAEAKYRCLVEESLLGVYVIQRGRFVYVNTCMADIFRCAREELVGRPVEELVFPEDRVLVIGNICTREMGQAHSIKYGFRGLRKDGEVIDVEVLGTGTVYNGQPAVIGSLLDVTERNRAEAALRESEAKYRLIVDTATEGICVLGSDERITFVNARLERMLGYSMDEITGRSLIEFLFEEDISDHRIRMENRRQGISETYERRFWCKDGQILWTLASTTPILDDKNEFAGSFSMFTDITDRKRAEDEHSRLRQHLQQAQKMEAIGQLAGGIAHDFNNMLGLINGYSELLLHEPQLDGATRLAIEEILAAGERAASLTRQLLTFSRKLVLQPKALNLNLVIEGMEKLLRRLIGDEIEIRTVLAPDLNTVLADPTQMEQVLLNFCINARDAMPEGGRITIESANVEVDEAQVAQHFPVLPGSYVSVAVSDTGTGMDKETLSHIFEPFFTTKGPERGTGLGLATVYGIINQSGGHVWACSEPGQGTTFFAYLPAANEEVTTRHRERQPREVLRGSETILLVEDLAPLRFLFRSVLEGSGYTVLEAEDSERAMQVADAFRGEISLLVTDISLPKTKGSALAKMLKVRRAAMKVLFVSGFTDAVIAPDGVLQPSTGFLQKPFPPETLIRKVRGLLDETDETFGRQATD